MCESVTADLLLRGRVGEKGYGAGGGKVGHPPV